MIYVRNQYCCIETSLWTYILPPRPFVVRALLQKQTRHTPDHHCRAESTYYLWDGSHQICFALFSEHWSMFTEHILQCFCTILAQGAANSFTISKVTYVLDHQQFKYQKHKYSCPCLVVQYTEELISRTFLGEIQFWLVSQDRVRSQNGIGCLVFVSQSLFV